MPLKAFYNTQLNRMNVFFASYFRLTPVLLLKSEWVFENIPQVQMSPFLHSQHDSTFGGRRCKVRYTANLGFHICEIWKISKLTLKCSLLRGALYKAHPNGWPPPTPKVHFLPRIYIHLQTPRLSDWHSESSSIWKSSHTELGRSVNLRTPWENLNELLAFFGWSKNASFLYCHSN